MDTTSVTIEKSKQIKDNKRKVRKDYTLLLYAMPFIIYTVIFRFIPLGGWSLAFFDYKLGLGLKDLEFVGFKYFKFLVEDWSIIKHVLINTLAMSGLLLINAPVAVFLAIMVNEVKTKRARSIVQTITTLPHFVSMIIVSSMFFTIFSYNGVLNEILFVKLHIIKEPMQVLSDPRMAWPFQLFVNLWKEAGWSTIVYLAAIAGIDQELYDAVEIDGGGRFRRIWHVTVPGIIPTFLVLLLLRMTSIINNGALWEQVFVFMNSLVQDKLEIFGYYTYRMGIVLQDYSYATTMEIINSVISILLLFGTNVLAKKVRGDSLI